MLENGEILKTGHVPHSGPRITGPVPRVTGAAKFSPTGEILFFLNSPYFSESKTYFFRILGQKGELPGAENPQKMAKNRYFSIKTGLRPSKINRKIFEKFLKNSLYFLTPKKYFSRILEEKTSERYRPITGPHR